MLAGTVLGYVYISEVGKSGASRSDGSFLVC